MTDPKSSLLPRTVLDEIPPSLPPRRPWICQHVHVLPRLLPILRQVDREVGDEPLGDKALGLGNAD